VAKARPPSATRIWDLPVRVFHWSLATAVVFSFVTGKMGGDALEWHFRSGYVIAALLLFRLAWGFAGSRYARFASFPPSVSRAWQMMRSGKSASASAGHSSLGALSVYALLLALLVQATTGMFANDGTYAEGPLGRFVSTAASNRLSTVHYYNHYLIAALTAMHVAAIAFYLFARRENLIVPMLTGDKHDIGEIAQAADDSVVIRIRAAVIAAVAAAFVYSVVTL